jgi:hypothetical protein
VLVVRPPAKSVALGVKAISAERILFFIFIYSSFGFRFRVLRPDFRTKRPENRCKGIAFGGIDQQKSGVFAQNSIVWAFFLRKTAHFGILCASFFTKIWKNR